MAFRVEEVVKNSFIRYVFGQENLVSDRKLSRKSQEILKLTLRGNPAQAFYGNCFIIATKFADYPNCVKEFIFIANMTSIPPKTVKLSYSYRCLV